ncbi:MAG: hypothetical protein IT267_12550 [Saprospiraceae bacterium]|nr:hypothetical protein [Saprospiraceae bacterium]
MHKKSYLVFIFFINLLYVNAQKTELSSVDSLKIWSDILYSGKLEETRIIASLNVENLLTRHIQNNDIGDLHPNIIVLKFPDQNQIICTWQVEMATGEFEYFGLLRNQKGEITKFKREIRDYTRIRREEFNEANWYGAVYYHILPQSFGKENYYILFGFAQNNLGERFKIIETINFKDGKPLFGSPVFPYTDQDGEKSDINRVIIRYSQSGTCLLRYEEVEKQIVFDHMINFQDTNSPEGSNYLPDGSYEAYEFKNNHWKYISKLNVEVQKTAPREMPILNNNDKDLFGREKRKK